MSLNSTITNDEFTPGKKLLVHLSENGHSFEFECDGSTPVEAIQRSIQSLSGVQYADQLLMCGKFSLDPQQPLTFYKLPQDDSEVFLYNKARLHADSPRPSPEVIDVPNVVIPSLCSLTNEKHPLDDASDPALKALASYEKQFRYHFQHANVYYVCTQAKFELCKRSLREQQVQERAMETARGNLDHTFKKLHQRYSEFIRCFSHQHRVPGELLENFERDVERLRSLRLHPLLQSEGRRCLLDLVKVEDLRKCAVICLNSRRQFESKVSQLKMSFVELKRRVENVFSGMSSGENKDLEGFIRDHQKVLNDQKSIMQSLSKDVNTVKKLVDDCLSCQLSTSLRPHDAVSALGPMYDVHEKNHLPKVQNCDNLITKLLDKCKGKKDGMNLLVHISMQKVKSAQFSIKDLMNQLHAFEEVMGHQDKEFENLNFVSGVGHAYRACLAEVIRRKSSLKLYMGFAGQLAERLATEREAEIRRRDGFYKEWSKYIPQDILAAMGLFDSPSQCDVNMAPFDTNLLDIDVVDVDRYAPRDRYASQAVVGFPLKSDKNKLTESYLAKSSESSNFIKSVDNDQYNVEGCDFADIVGTSKIEVDNARLKAELASAIAIICTFDAGIGCDSFDKGEPDEILKLVKEKTSEALDAKDGYVKHLQSMLHAKQVQCSSYEKRIQELEQRLEEQYVHGQKISANNASDTHIPCISSVSMDEGSSTSVVDPKHDIITGQTSKSGEGGDENMTDQSGNFMDASMQETTRDERQVGDSDIHRALHEDKNLVGDANREMKMITDVDNPNSTKGAVDMLASEVAAENTLESEKKDGLVLALRNSLQEKSNQLIEAKSQFEVAMEEIRSLRGEMEVSQNLLDESQMNCAHLENFLHEAREEARTNLCAADRRASEYSSLRTSAVKMRGLFERFRSCVTAQVGVANFADALRSLALSLASSVSEDEDDGTAEFRLSIKVLSDKVGSLSRHRSELLDRCSRAESALEEKTEQIRSLYAKHQLEKQVSKEKISFVRLEVHELACFILNSTGHYEAIHWTCSNYYLSSESVALFTEHYSERPPYIVGQIVHIDTKVDVPNPYGLPSGCEYFVVTVAMLPDTICSAAS